MSFGLCKKGGKRKRKKEHRLLFLFLGLGLSLVLLSVIVRLDLYAPMSIGGSDGPDYDRLLPGATVHAGSAVELVDQVRPAHVVAFSRDGVGGLALVAWDAARQRYENKSELLIGGLDPRLVGLPLLTKAALGPGAAEAIRLQTDVAGSGVEAVAFVVRRADTLQPIKLQDSRQRLRPAVFVNGQYEAANYEFRLQDVDGDDVPEAVVESRSFGGAGGGVGYTTSVDVYVWRNQLLVYDKELSWAMTTSATLFPSPSL